MPAPLADAGAPTGVLTKPPALKRQVEAAYPPDAAAQQLEGTVVMLIDISETGAVTDVQVTQPAGHGFDEAAVAAVQQFQFEPAEVDNVPAPVRIQYAYQFVWRAGAAARGHRRRRRGAPRRPVNFSGQALERGTRKPLDGAEVALPELELTTVTDAEGRFSFRGVPRGTHEVLVVLGGYDRFRTKETHRRGPGDAGHVLRAEAHLQPVRDGGAQRARAQGGDAHHAPGGRGAAHPRHPGRHAEGGAEPARRGAARLQRRRSSSSAAPARRTPASSWTASASRCCTTSAGSPPSTTRSCWSRWTTCPATSPRYYGDVTGGVINVRSRAPRTDRFHGTVGVSLIESNAVLEGADHRRR